MAIENVQKHLCSLAETQLSRMIPLIEGHNKRGLPGVVRRRDETVCPENIPIGFSSPFRIDGVRVRVASEVPVNQVVEVYTPYEIYDKACKPGLNTHVTEILQQLPVPPAGAEIGLFGAMAFEVMSGLNCFDTSSDVDLILKGFTLGQLEFFLKSVQVLATKISHAFDIEVWLGNGRGVKLQELFLDTKSCLVKGNESVELITRSQLYDMLAVLVKG
ncbi:MAG: hypothetical protein GX811_07085 [Lentisphaerae bacterium]|nr:hypothetical protein [Lentisphaerota bacterium]